MRLHLVLLSSIQCTHTHTRSSTHARTHQHLIFFSHNFSLSSSFFKNVRYDLAGAIAPALLQLHVCKLSFSPRRARLGVKRRVSARVTTVPRARVCKVPAFARRRAPEELLRKSLFGSIACADATGRKSRSTAILVSFG